MDATSRMKLNRKARQGKTLLDCLSGMPPRQGIDSLVARNIPQVKSVAFSWKSKCDLLRIEGLDVAGRLNWIHKLGRKDLVVRNETWCLSKLEM